MTNDSLLAEAVAADREADAIFSKIDAARGRDGALIPAGFEGEAARASDLRRRAAVLRAEAGEVTPVAVTSHTPTARKEPPAKPAVPVEPVETVESVAARIIASDDSIAAGAVAPLSPVPPAAVENTVEAVAARILAA